MRSNPGIIHKPLAVWSSWLKKLVTLVLTLIDLAVNVSQAIYSNKLVTRLNWCFLLSMKLHDDIFYKC